MFVFGLKKSQVGVAMALLLLCFSICPYSTHPHHEEAEDPMDAEDEEVRMVNEEDGGEAVQDEDEDTEEEQDLMEDDTGVENAPKEVDPFPGDPNPLSRAQNCKKVTEPCDFPYHCCFGLTCTDKKCVDLVPPKST